MKMSKWVSTLTVGMLLAATPAFADDAKGKPAAPADTAKQPKPPSDAPAASSEAAAEVKVGTGIAKREVVGEGDSFAAGTKVWAWSKVTGAKGTTIKHVWKRGDKVLWEKTFDATSNRYRTWTKHTVKAGSYTVEVQSEDGTVLGTTAFTVT